jgi:glucose/mannose-6-phosphate isomerase
MAGSDTAGDVCRLIVGGTSTLFVQTVRDSLLPNWAGKDTLVVAVSYSGDTAEVLNVVDLALDRSVQLLLIASDGRLLARAQQLRLRHIAISKGYPPRAAIGYSCSRHSRRWNG